MSKADAINIMNNSNLNDKSGSLQIFLLYIKMGETTYCQRNSEILLNRAKKYYENNKEVLAKKLENKYRELSNEKKNIKREYGRNRYKNV